MIKMVGFDLDGTICDSIPMCLKAFTEAVIPYVDHELTEKEVVSTFGLNETGMVKAIVKNGWEDALSRFYENYYNLHDMCIIPFKGIYELITFLKQNQIIVPLITGKGEKSCEITLKKLGLNQLFDDILYGSEKYRCKRDNILYLLEKYAVKKDEFFYVGDTIQDIADCTSIGVTCLSAAWAELSNPQKLKDSNPYTFESVIELNKFLNIKIEHGQRNIFVNSREVKIEMTNFMELVKKRYSVRNFERKKVEPEKVALILEAGRLAPTACNNQPQRIFVLDSIKNLELLKKCTPFTFDAPLILLICYDSKISWKNPSDNQDMGIVDASIVATHMMLETANLGLGSTWVGRFDACKIKKLYSLPESYVPIAILPIGYPDKTSTPHINHNERLKLETTTSFL